MRAIQCEAIKALPHRGCRHSELFVDLKFGEAANLVKQMAARDYVEAPVIPRDSKRSRAQKAAA